MTPEFTSQIRFVTIVKVLKYHTMKMCGVVEEQLHAFLNYVTWILATMYALLLVSSRTENSLRCRIEMNVAGKVKFLLPTRNQTPVIDLTFA
jgi:hypothetical protein